MLLLQTNFVGTPVANKDRADVVVPDDVCMP